MGVGDMELRQLRYFCKACEEGSYMAAEGKGVAFALAGHPMLGGGRNLVALPFRPAGTGEGGCVTTPMNLVLRRDRRPKSPARLLASWLLEVWGAGGE